LLERRQRGSPLLPASSELLLVFYFREPYTVHFRETGVEELAPRNVVVGPQTYCRTRIVDSPPCGWYTRLQSRFFGRKRTRLKSRIPEMQPGYLLDTTPVSQKFAE
jgi:hypothetical protein